MKLSSCLSLATIIAVAFAAPFISPENDGVHTIWAESAVTSMRNTSNALYEASIILYNNRHIFDNGNATTLNCSAGAYDGTTSVCTQADKLVASTETALSNSWASLARAMFPISYGLPDNSHERRATFSDFSHFYNYMFIEMNIWMNITAWYACQGGFRGQSATENITLPAYIFNEDEPITRNGPYIECPNHRSKSCIAGNGTQLEYEHTSIGAKFAQSWSKTYQAFFYNIYFLSNLMNSELNIQGRPQCPRIVAAGVSQPVAPKDLWTVHTSYCGIACFE